MPPKVVNFFTSVHIVIVSVHLNGQRLNGDNDWVVLGFQDGLDVEQPGADKGHGDGGGPQKTSKPALSIINLWGGMGK